MIEQPVDWGLESWEPRAEDSDPTELEDFYYKPISPKEEICDKCRIPKPCWC